MIIFQWFNQAGAFYPHMRFIYIYIYDFWLLQLMMLLNHPNLPPWTAPTHSPGMFLKLTYLIHWVATNAWWAEQLEVGGFSQKAAW